MSSEGEDYGNDCDFCGEADASACHCDGQRLVAEVRRLQGEMERLTAERGDPDERLTDMRCAIGREIRRRMDAAESPAVADALHSLDNWLADPGRTTALLERRNTPTLTDVLRGTIEWLLSLDAGDSADNARRVEALKRMHDELRASPQRNGLEY